MSPKRGMRGEKCELRAPLRPEDLCLVRRPLPRHCHESGNPGFLPGFLLAQEGHIASAGLSRGGERRAGIEPASLTPSVPMGYVNRPTPVARNPARLATKTTFLSTWPKPWRGCRLKSAPGCWRCSNARWERRSRSASSHHQNLATGPSKKYPPEEGRGVVRSMLNRR